LGASISLIICFVIYLFINRKNLLAEKIYLLASSGIIALGCVCVGIIGMGRNDIIALVPLVVLGLGMIILEHWLYAKEKFLTNILPKILKYVVPIMGTVIVLLIVGVSLGKPVKFSFENHDKIVSIMLEQGDYEIRFMFDREIDSHIQVDGQTYEQAGTRDFDVLYEGVLSGKNLKLNFSTKENNKAIRLTIGIWEDAILESAYIYNSDNELVKKIMLDRLIVPNFIENRLSPFSANQNAIQRFTFFEDGIKVWQRSQKSMLIGNGPNGFINYAGEVKESAYSTQSSHNFLIDTLCDTGVIGCISIVSIVLYAFYLTVWKQKVSNDNIMNILSVIIIFIVGHSLIELNFIYIPYYLTFGLLLGMISTKSEEKINNRVIIGVNTICMFIICAMNIVLLADYYYGLGILPSIIF